MPAIACTSCKRSLTVAENLVGKAIKCPACAATFVAAVNGAPSNGTKPPAPAAPSAPPAAKPPVAAPKSITLPCNQCKKPLTIPETLLGKGVKCPQCAAVFTAQAPQVKATAAQAPKPTGVSAVAPAAARPPAMAPKSVTLPCNQCKKPLTIPDTLLGKAVKCPQCAAVFTAQQPGKPVAPSVPAGARPPAPTPTAPNAPTVAPPGFVNLACEACKKPLRLPDKLIGSAVKCPHCAGVFTAKKPGSPAPAAAPPAATKPMLPPAAAGPTRPTLPSPSVAKPLAPPAAPSKPPMPASVAAKPPAPPANAPKAPAAGTGEPKVTIHCVRCKRPLRLPESALGKPLRCPRCRMIFAAKPKPPDAASWINYPLEKPVEDRGAPGAKGSPAAPKAGEPPAPPDKVVRVESLPGAAPPKPAPSRSVAPDEVTEWESATEPGLEEVAASAQTPVSHEEPVPAPREPETPAVSTESAEDVFAAHMPKKKKNKKAPPPPPIEEPTPEPEYAAESGDAEPIGFAPESAVAEGEPHAESEAEAYGMADAEGEAPEEEMPEGAEGKHPGHDGEQSGGSAAKWFAVGLFLGGISAAGVGALFVFHVV